MQMPFSLIPNSLLVSLMVNDNPEINKALYFSVKKETRTTLLNQFGLKTESPSERLKILQQFFTASGWGEIKNTDIDKKEKRAIVVVANSPVSTQKGKYKKPVDHLMRGILAGMFSDLFKTNMECIETKCVALNDPSCHFIIKKAEMFDLTKKETADQIKPGN